MAACRWKGNTTVINISAIHRSLVLMGVCKIPSAGRTHATVHFYAGGDKVGDNLFLDEEEALDSLRLLRKFSKHRIILHLLDDFDSFCVQYFGKSYTGSQGVEEFIRVTELRTAGCNLLRENSHEIGHNCVVRSASTIRRCAQALERSGSKQRTYE